MIFQNIGGNSRFHYQSENLHAAEHLYISEEGNDLGASICDGDEDEDEERKRRGLSA